MIPVPRFTGNLQAWASQLTNYLRTSAEQTFPVRLRHLATGDDAKAVEAGVLMYQPVNTSVVCSCGEGWRQLLSVHTIAEGVDPLQSILTIQGAVGQSTSLQEWLDSAGAILALINSNGNFLTGARATGTPGDEGASIRSNGIAEFNRAVSGNAQFNLDANSAVGYFESTATGVFPLVVAGGNIVLQAPSVPTSSSATGSAGEMAWDANYLYVCTTTNTWKRAALSTW